MTCRTYRPLTVLMLALAAAVVSAQGSPSGDFGSLAFGEGVEGRIAGVAPGADAEPVVYHSYVVDVPAEVPEVLVTVQGFGSDLDLAIKVGGPILSYDDVDVLDVEETLDPSATVAIAEGERLYVDVLNLLPAAARYRLTVEAADTTAGPSSGEAAEPGDAGASANPLARAAPASSDDPFAGTFEGDGLRARFTPSPEGYVGELELDGSSYTLQASADEGSLTGRFATEAGEFDFTAELDGEALLLTSGGATYRLAAQGAPANPLAAGEAASGGNGAAAASDGTDASEAVLAQGAHGTLREDDALAFLEALEFSLQQVGYAGTFTQLERDQMLQAIAQSYATLTADEQAVLAQARDVWTRVQANWPNATAAEREEFVTGVFVLAFGEQAMEQAASAAGGGGASSGAECGDIDSCISRYADPDTLSDTMNAQSCWAAAGCSGYDPVGNDFSYDSYDGY